MTFLWLQGLTLLSLDLQVVATDLIKEFGAIGTFLFNDNEPDPITGVKSGSSSEIEVEYFRTFYETKDLIENRILSGDAKILFVSKSKPKTNWSFKDSNFTEWNVLSFTPIEAQGLMIVYEGHIRK